MMVSQIERQGASYRQGLVLGLTMAEIMLLLVFCLLIASGVSLSFERKQTGIAKQQLAQLVAVEGSPEQLAQQLALANANRDELLGALQMANRTRVALIDAARNDPTATEFLHALGAAEQGRVDEAWRRLVESSEAVRRLESAGISRKTITAHPEVFAAADKLRNAGADLQSLAERAASSDKLSRLMSEAGLPHETPEKIVELLKAPPAPP
jgi:hypothetical protein